MQKRFIAHSYHGSSTKAAGTAGAAVQACKSGLKPDVIIGVSGGAILAVPMAMGMYNEVLEFSRNMRMMDWFDIPPVNDKGRISWGAIWRIIKMILQAICSIFFVIKNPIYSLGVQNTQRKLSEIITPEIFDAYKKGIDYAPCYIVSVDWCKRSLVVRNAKDLNYKQYLDAVHCSSVLPISSTGGRVNNGALEFDGGLCTQNASWWLLKHPLFADKITDLISIYISPNNNTIPDLNEPNSIIAAVMGTIDIMQQDNYRQEEKDEAQTCLERGINLYDAHLPLILESKYDTNFERLAQLQKMGAIVMQEEIQRKAL